MLLMSSFAATRNPSKSLGFTDSDENGGVLGATGEVERVTRTHAVSLRRSGRDTAHGATGQAREDDALLRGRDDAVVREDGGQGLGVRGVDHRSILAAEKENVNTLSRQVRPPESVPKH